MSVGTIFGSPTYSTSTLVDEVCESLRMLSYLKLKLNEGEEIHLNRTGPGRIYSYNVGGDRSGEWTFGEDQIEEIVSSALQECVRVKVISTRFNLEGMLSTRHEKRFMKETRFIVRRNLRSRWGSWQWENASTEFFD